MFLLHQLLLLICYSVWRRLFNFYGKKKERKWYSSCLIDEQYFIGILNIYIYLFMCIQYVADVQ